MNEADTCRTYNLPKLKSVRWEDVGLQAKVYALREHQSVSGEELSALTPFVLDKAFKGEL